MKLKHNTAALAVTVLLLASGSGAVNAEESHPLERRLVAMQTKSDAEYVTARDALLEAQDSVVPFLESRHSASKYTEKSWREDVLTEVALFWAKSPELARRLYALEGVDPAHYLGRRRPEPEVSTELRRLKNATAILFELELKTRDVYPFADVARYPNTLSKEAMSTLRAQERIALRTGVLTAIGRSKHPAAGLVLREIVQNREEDAVVRRVAALGLGQTNALGAISTLSALATNSAESAELRTSAIAGLGQLRSVASLEVLTRIASREPELRSCAVVAIGTLANAWVLKNQNVDSREYLRDRASRVLVNMLESTQAEATQSGETDSIIEAMVMISNPALRSLLGAIVEDEAHPQVQRNQAEKAIERLDLAQSREDAL